MSKFERNYLVVLFTALFLLVSVGLYQTQEAKNAGDMPEPTANQINPLKLMFPKPVKPYIVVTPYFDGEEAYKMTAQEKEKFAVNN